MRCSLSKGERFLLVLLLPFFATPALKRYSLSLSRSLSLANQRDCGSSVCATTVSSPMKTRWDDRHFFDDTKANSFLLLVFIYISGRGYSSFSQTSKVKSKVIFFSFYRCYLFLNKILLKNCDLKSRRRQGTVISRPGWRNID